MGIFSRRKRVEGPGLWEALDEKQKAYAHRLADWLAVKTGKLPVRRVRLYVMLVLVGIASVNTVNMVVAIRRNGNRDINHFGTIKTTVVPGPRIPRKPGARQSLERYLDSLRRDSTGRRLLDSLLSARPGLADTINEVERMRP